MPQDKLHSHNPRGGHGEEDSETHRLEAFAAVFLSLWVSADILVDYGHNTLALGFFSVAQIIPLYLLAFHIGKGWPRRKKVAKWAFIVGVLGFSGVLYAVSRITAFSVETLENFSAIDGIMSGNSLWCVYRNADVGEDEKSPICWVAYMRFTNEKESPVFVHGFSVETKDPKGIWETVPIIDVQPGEGSDVKFYVCTNTPTHDPDFTKAQNWDFLDFLQARFAEGPIASEKPVQGWILFDAPKCGVINSRDLRVSIDTGDEIITRPIKFHDTRNTPLDIQIVKPFPAMRPNCITNISKIPPYWYGTKKKIQME
jgi:hypothetical protein